MKCLLNKDLHVAYPCSPSCALFGDCITAYEKSILRKQKTNLDHVRTLTGEELAWCISCWQDWGGGLDPEDWLEWLQKPWDEKTWKNTFLL